MLRMNDKIIEKDGKFYRLKPLEPNRSHEEEPALEEINIDKEKFLTETSDKIREISHSFDELILSTHTTDKKIHGAIQEIVSTLWYAKHKTIELSFKIGSEDG